MGGEGGSRLRRAGRPGDLAPGRSASRCGRCRAGKRVLDIATGPGYVAARAAERGAESVGVDFSENMLAFARTARPASSSCTATRPSCRSRTIPSMRRPAHFCCCISAGRKQRQPRPPAFWRLAAALRTASGTSRRGAGGSASCSTPSRPGCATAGRRAARPSDLPVRRRREFTRLLTAAGLADVVIETVEFPLELASADDLWNGLVDGSVRVRPLILGQSPETRRAMRMHFDELLEDYRTEEGLSVPVSVKLTTARKP